MRDVRRAQIPAVRLFSRGARLLFHMEANYTRLAGGAPTAFVDQDGYRKFVAQKEREFRSELARQAGRRAPPTSGRNH